MYIKNKKEMMNKVKQYVEAYYAEHHRMPSNAEVAAEFDVNRTTIYRYMKEIGEINGNFSVIDKVDTEMVSIPLAGSIPCGTPDQREQSIEAYYTLPKALVGNGEFYMLIASGESMIDAGIEDGDLVIVKRQFDASEGKIVAALVENESTLKTLKFDDAGIPYLHPENSSGKFKDIKGFFNIQGVAVRIIKKLP